MQIHKLYTSLEAWYKEVTRPSIIPKCPGYEWKVSSSKNIPTFINFVNSRALVAGKICISGIIKVEVSVISLSLRLRLITLTETLIIPDITKTKSNNCFIIHSLEENNDKRIIAAITVYFQTLKNVHVQLSDKQIPPSL